MYNGQPPAYPQGGALPPFPPFRPPVNGAMPQPGFPPFLPPQGFVPPFPPTFPPGMQPPSTISSPGFGSPATPGMPPSMQQGTPGGMPMRPPPMGMGYAPRPSHPGLGSQPMHGLPPVPQTPMTPRTNVKTTKVFVGSISPGISDETLSNLLNACGPLHDFKRVSDASGQPKSFGFAEFENPEVVLRTMRCLNGVELPDMTPEGERESRPAKVLTVKADKKTQEFLEEFESTLGRSDSDEQADASTRKSIQHIIHLLIDPSGATSDRPGDAGLDDGSIEVIVPPHLQDLQEGDLPEDQRRAVLGQIAVFRENAAKREREKKLMEEEKERYKAMQAQGQGGHNRAQAPSGYGYGNGRGLGKQQQQAEMRWNNQNQNNRNGPGGAGPSRQPQERDPQGYDKPVAFVKANTVEGKAESGRTDEEEEELRRERIQREKDIALRDAERRVEARERARIEGLNREMGQRKAQADMMERNKARQEDIYEGWDDDELIERGRELFYSDRAQWRARRQNFRQSEYQADLRDRQQEEDERQALERESEEFLKRQMAELAELEKSQKARGLLTEDAAPIKLAINTMSAPPPPKEEKKSAVTAKPGVQLQGDDEDEDEEGGKKKKRTFVRLDEDEPEEGLSEAEKKVRRNAKLLEIKKVVPTDRRGLWNLQIEWAAVSDHTLQSKIKPFVQSKIKQYLGELDEDLADFVLEHLRDHKGAEDLVDGLDPILAEDSESFVLQLWKQLGFESAAYKAGIDTGSMMV